MQRKSQDGISLPEFLERFSTDEACRELLERIRWPEGRYCPHCGGLRSWPIHCEAARAGLYECADCHKQFTATVGTVFEDSKIGLPKWFLAIYLMLDSKKGISSNQMARVLGVTYKTAWFVTHRVRMMMTETDSKGKPLQGVVEVDETYVGGKPRKHSGKKSKRGRGTEKVPVMVLVERGGIARSRVIERVNARTLKGAIRENVARTAVIMTDEFASYKGLDEEFADHGVVNHSQGQYTDGEKSTNRAESFFALLKRGLIGTFHQMSRQHLDRYCTEFNFRWNARDAGQMENVGEVLNGAIGKRLTYYTVVQNGKSKAKGRKATDGDD